ncbi:MAG: porin, partial [bacterium]
MKKTFAVLSGLVFLMFFAVIVNAMEITANPTVLGQLIYVADQSDTVSTGSTLDINRLRVGVSAEPHEKVTAKASFEFTNNLSPLTAGLGGRGGTSAESALVSGSISRVVDMYVDISLTDEIDLLIGQMPVGIGLENTTDEYSQPTINYSQMVGNIHPGRDRGVVLTGKTSEIFNWSFAILQSFGMEPAAGTVDINGYITGAKNDSNDRKAVLLALGVKPVETVYFEGYYLDDETTGPPATVGNSDIKVFGFTFDYKYAGFRLSSEYGELKYKPDTITGLTTNKAKDWYITGSYAFP